MRRDRDEGGRTRAVTMTRDEWDHTCRSHKHDESGGGRTVLVTDPAAGGLVRVMARVVPNESPEAIEGDR